MVGFETRERPLIIPTVRVSRIFSIGEIVRKQSGMLSIIGLKME